MESSILLTRREAIKRTFVFSAGVLASGWLSKLGAQAQSDFSDQGIHLLALGDFGYSRKHRPNEPQAAVARQMEAFAKKLNKPLTAVLALGDNFYKQWSPDRFQFGFEEMYSKEHLNCPFYAVVGNHDYFDYEESVARWKAGNSIPDPRKYEAQIAYARDNPTSRWKMPARWYSVELPNVENPMVKIIVLDTNVWEGAMSPQDKIDQQRFLDEEIKKGTRAPWTWVATHYPLFTASSSRKCQISAIHAERLQECLKSNPISFYWCGHDHNLQHLEVEGYHTSFVVSGAGGAPLIKVGEAEKGFAEMVLGFNHIHITPKWTDTQFIDSEGRRLHAFRRTIDGTVEILA